MKTKKKKVIRVVFELRIRIKEKQQAGLTASVRRMRELAHFCKWPVSTLEGFEFRLNRYMVNSRLNKAEWVRYL